MSVWEISILLEVKTVSRSQSQESCFVTYTRDGHQAERLNNRPWMKFFIAPIILKVVRSQGALTLVSNAEPKPRFPLKCRFFWLVWVQPCPFLPLGTVRRGVLGHSTVVHTCALERQSWCMNATNCYIVWSKRNLDICRGKVLWNLNAK